MSEEVERPDLLSEICEIIDAFERRHNVWVEGKESLKVTEK